ncbi:MAG: hypothetical protein KGY70_17475 [Bacteroidales bacterium]|nr:hypothetical protein [Bacteroidales bacterium]
MIGHTDLLTDVTGEVNGPTGLLNDVAGEMNTLTDEMTGFTDFINGLTGEVNLRSPHKLQTVNPEIGILSI